MRCAKRGLAVLQTRVANRPAKRVLTFPSPSPAATAICPFTLQFTGYMYFQFPATYTLFLASTNAARLVFVDTGAVAASNTATGSTTTESTAVWETMGNLNPKNLSTGWHAVRWVVCMPSGWLGLGSNRGLRCCPCRGCCPLPPAPSSSPCALSPCRLEYWQGQVSGGVALSWSAWGFRGSTPTWGSLIDKQIVPAASLYTIGDT